MAKNFWKKSFVPLGGNDDEEYYDEEEMMEDQYGEDSYEDEPERQEPAYEEPSFSRRRSKVISMPENRTSASGDTQMKMIIFRPTSYDETQSVIDSLKARKPIIVNLDEIDVAVAQRILDFISGAVYALGGDIKKAARNIFVVAPSNVEVTSNMSAERSSGDFDFRSV